MSEHIVSRKLYYAIFSALMVLTAITVGVAYVDLGRFSIVVALAIAGVKAALVIMYFMHVKYSSGLTKIFILASFFWLAILLALTFSDYISRGWLPVPRGW